MNVVERVPVMPPSPLAAERALFEDLRSHRDGLSTRDADRRLIELGANEITARRDLAFPPPRRRRVDAAVSGAGGTSASRRR